MNLRAGCVSKKNIWRFGFIFAYIQLLSYIMFYCTNPFITIFTSVIVSKEILKRGEIEHRSQGAFTTCNRSKETLSSAFLFVSVNQRVFLHHCHAMFDLNRDLNGSFIDYFMCMLFDGVEVFILG